MENILAMLSEATKEVFQTMMSYDIDTYQEKLDEFADKIHMSTIITLDGTIKGALVFHCSNNFAQKITSALLNTDPSDTLEEVEIKDAISELTNIIAGTLKNKINNLGHTFTLSIPKNLNWSEYINETKHSKKERIIKFKSKDDYFFLELLSHKEKELKKAS
ncbi:MAG: chemotaxis protein CheX [Candidatus Schekmanbacteria bacterium]|nr:MAG: chemotaxis protein CheX [Candidatus Schekmanbacteria bacterium]